MGKPKTTIVRPIAAYPTYFFLKKGPTPASFLFLFSVFSNKQYNYHTNQCKKNVMSIQYMAQGIEPTTS